MSSTSTSECDCEEYSQNAFGYGSYYDAAYETRPPVYSVGHPLIYYAKVQHQPMTRRQSSRENRKGNRNCFMKAFRWYTQEHKPAQRTPEISGFATWLDAKYGEYLRDSRLNQTSQSPPQLKQTPTSDGNSDLCDACADCANKKTARTRSPWRKRKRTSKEAGDVCNKPNRSCEFIMLPKDSPRQASECCHTTPTSINKKSSATLISSRTNSATKTIIKSLSLTCCSCERNKSLNRKPLRDESNIKEMEKLMRIILPEAKETRIIEQPKKSSEKQEDETSCQCPEYKVVNVDAETQYLKAELDNKRSADQMKPVPCKKQSKPKVLTNTGQQKEVVKQKNKQPTNLEPNIICQCSEESIKKVKAHSQCFSSEHMKTVPCKKQSKPKIQTNTGQQKEVVKQKNKQPTNLEPNIICQCSEESIKNVNAHSQCCSSEQMKTVPSKKQSKTKVQSNTAQQKEVVKQKNIQPANLEPNICQCSDENVKKVNIHSQCCSSEQMKTVPSKKQSKPKVQSNTAQQKEVVKQKNIQPVNLEPNKCQCSDENMKKVDAQNQCCSSEQIKLVPSKKQLTPKVQCNTGQQKDVVKQKNIQPANLEPNIICECSDESIKKVDAQSQCCSSEQIKLVPSKKQTKPKVQTNTRQQKDVIKQTHIQPANMEPDNICECSDESIKKVDAQSQYQSKFGAWPDNASHGVCDCKQEMRPTCAAGLCGLPAANVMETHHIRNVIYTRSRPFLVNDIAQTSDHSIDLERETVHGYPLFMKIVRADKLH